MKRVFLVLVCLLGWLAVHAQKYYITNQYIYDLYLMNPAAAGFYKGCYTVNGFYQKQWYGVDQAPTTQILSFQGPATESLGIGVYAYNDRNGNYGEMGVQAALSYEILLIKKRRTTSTLTFGMAFMGEQSSVDFSNLSDEAMNDPVVANGIEKGMGLNASAGAILKYNHYHAGFSVTNILPQTNPMYIEDEEPDLTMDLHFHLGGTYKLNHRDVFFEPLIMYRRNMDVNSRLDLSIKSLMPTPDRNLSFWSVVAYRRDMDDKFGNSTGLVTTAGVYYHQFNVGLEYQLGLTGARSDYGNYYKLVVGYRFCKKRTKGSIPCSEIRRNKRKYASKTVKKLFEEDAN